MRLDGNFFDYHGPIALGMIYPLVGESVPEGVDPEVSFRDIAMPEDATPEDIVFIRGARDLKRVENSRAGCVLLPPRLASMAKLSAVVVVTPTPQIAFGRIMEALYSPKPSWRGIHTSAEIAPSVSLGREVTVGPGSRVGEGVKIGDYCHLGANAVVEAGSTIGSHSWIGNNVSIRRARIGHHACIGDGAVLGSRGFGFSMETDGYEPFPQYGRVCIGNYVEISASTVVACGQGLRDTIIEDHCKVDALCYVSHNCYLDHHAVLCGMAGMAGRVSIGHHAILGPQAGIAGGRHVGAWARVGPQSGVTCDIPDKMDVIGSPAKPNREFLREIVQIRRALQKFSEPGGR